MSIATPSSSVVTRAVDLLAAAGIRVRPIVSATRIDRDEYEATSDELADRDEQRADDAVTITGRHEDHGSVTLRRDAGVFTIEAEELAFVRSWGEPMEAAD